MGLDWAVIKDFISDLGVTKGIFVIFFFLSHHWIFKMYNGRLNDRQKEIDRLAEDNREYRNRFLSLLDEKFSYDPNKTKSKKRK